MSKKIWGLGANQIYIVLNGYSHMAISRSRSANGGEEGCTLRYPPSCCIDPCRRILSIPLRAPPPRTIVSPPCTVIAFDIRGLMLVIVTDGEA